VTDKASLDALVSGGTATKVSATANSDAALATSTLAAGTYKVYAVDGTGNVSAASTATVTLQAPDSTPPSVTVSGGTVTIGQTVTAQSNEDGWLYLAPSGSTVTDKASLDGLVSGGTATKVSATANSDAALATSTLAAGNYKVYAVDGTGNVSAASSATITLQTPSTPDSTPPTVTVSGGTVTIGQTVTAQSNENGWLYLAPSGSAVTDKASLDALVSGGTATKVSATANSDAALATTTLAAGNYKVYAVDGTGNVSAASTATITLQAPDSTPPTVTVSGGTVTIGQTVTAQSNENGWLYLAPSGSAVTDKASLDGLVSGGTATKVSATANSDAALATSTLAAGTYKVYAVDGTGNVSAASTATVTLQAPDSTPPTVTVSGGTVTIGQTVTAQSNENGWLYLAPSGSAVTDKASLDGLVSGGTATKVSATANSDAALATSTLAAGNYKVYAVDGTGNVSAASSATITLQTPSTPDSTPPTVTVSGGTVTIGQTVTAQSNENGWLYLAPSGSAVTDKASLDGLVSGGTATKVSATANSDAALATTGLAAGTYKVYAVDGTGNVSAASTGTITLQTPSTPDTTPPDWAATYPKAGTITDTSANVLAKANESGRAYYVVLPNGAPAPTATQVKAGQNASGADVGSGKKGYVDLTANAEATISIPNLSASTDYDVYVVVEDSATNVQAAPTKVDIATSAAPGGNGPTITTQALPNATVATPYNATVDVSGGALPYTWSISSGALPAGLDLNTVTGAVYGTPTTAGTANFAVRVIDQDAQTATASFTLQVNNQSQSGNNMISALTLSGLSLNETVSSAVYDYTATAPFALTATTVTATIDPTAAVRVNGEEVTNGQPSRPIPLTVGPNTIWLIVTAQDGTPKTYTVTVTREADAAAAALKDLQIGFQSGDEWNTVQHDVTLPVMSTGSFPVVWTSSNPSIISTNGTVQRPSGSADASVTLTATINLPGNPVKKTFLVIVKPQAPGTVQTSQRTVDVKAGENGDTAARVDVTRAVWSTPDGDSKVADSVRLDEQKASQSVAEAVYRQEPLIRIDLTDPIASQADIFNVGVDSNALARLNSYGKELQIASPDVKVDIPQASIQALCNDGIDLYFRVVPIKRQPEVERQTELAQSNDNVRRELGVSSVQIQVLGRPMTIETNLSDRRTLVTFPLPSNLSDADVASLKVWVQHTDGTEEVKSGSILRNSQNQPSAIEIEINKFSVFTIVRATAPQNNGGGSGGGGGSQAKPVENPKITIHPYVFGYPDRTFRPEQPITRGELAALIARQLPSNADTIVVDYPDVPSTYWALDSIRKLYALKLIQGYPDGAFRPDQYVTRAELAALVTKWKKMTDTGKNTFGDVQGHWAEPAIATMAAANILHGYPDGTFQPDKAITRAEMVYLMNQLIGRKPLTGITQTSWSDVPVDHWAAGAIEAASTTYTIEKAEEQK
ncbi:S-layer homology domain-containing protein, partial [Heliomicrobium gestii]